MASVADVAAYILRDHSPMSAMKLQKLCYFAYGYHLAWEDRQLFPERFEAWANGPVVYELYSQHRGQYRLQAGDINGNPAALDRDEKESIDAVLESFDSYTAHELSAMTHKPGPWLDARKRAGMEDDLQRSNEELRDEDIEDYFGALVGRQD
ncbi:Panacea domain-containing protein [Streptomyces sp. NRRL F-5630]|uniref:Panacea domain-containing protein n=1 Tax=Streptomyces sp. NRRL F-5630 TaxID=1463864 RepID=UPI003D7477BA